MCSCKPRCDPFATSFLSVTCKRKSLSQGTCVSIIDQKKTSCKGGLCHSLVCLRSLCLQLQMCTPDFVLLNKNKISILVTSLASRLTCIKPDDFEDAPVLQN
uniref:Uncharacterized protein n=1 Tax=Opuntia streptacantha TaxID=393608 RepID=A0A7C9D0L0_OPUST